MAELEGQEKTEQPTDKKLKDSRDKGQVAKSIEINSLAVFGSGLILIYLTHHFVSGLIASSTIKIFSHLDVLELTASSFQRYFQAGVLGGIYTLLPIFGGVFLFALIAGISQVGFKISPKALAPKFSKLNPLKGIKRILFSTRSLMEIAKSLMKLFVVGGAIYIILTDFILESTRLVELSVAEIASYMADSVFTLVWKVALVYSVIAVIDFIYQKRKFKKDMMMTKREVKDEYKQSEGDPLIKSRIKKVQYEMSKNRMIQEVAKADVVITNPTHYAVALKYEMSKDSAPKVVAKGVDELARKIKEVATEHSVPIHEDVELARALYKQCDIGERIPENLFKAVAQILAYIFRLKEMNKHKYIV